MNAKTLSQVQDCRLRIADCQNDKSEIQSPRATDELWELYRREHDIETRNALIEAYIPIVSREASKIAQALYHMVSVEELESAGTLGLIDCIDSFDPDQGFKFITFCTPRIRGAIFDELRSWDWTPRATRAKLNRLERAAQGLENRLGRAPDDVVQLASETGMAEDEVRKLLVDKQRSLLSLDRTWSTSDDRGAKDESPMTVLEDRRETDPSGALQKKEIADAVHKMLTRTERLVVTLYYYEQLTLREIGEVLGLTESRICQIHSKVVRRLKKQFA